MPQLEGFSLYVSNAAFLVREWLSYSCKSWAVFDPVRYRIKIEHRPACPGGAGPSRTTVSHGDTDLREDSRLRTSCSDIFEKGTRKSIYTLRDHCVSISTPSDVMSSVCSNWAVSRPSVVTAVHPSFHILLCVPPPRVNIGSIVNVCKSNAHREVMRKYGCQWSNWNRRSYVDWKHFFFERA